MGTQVPNLVGMSDSSVQQWISSLSNYNPDATSVNYPAGTAFQSLLPTAASAYNAGKIPSTTPWVSFWDNLNGYGNYDGSDDAEGGYYYDGSYTTYDGAFAPGSSGSSGFSGGLNGGFNSGGYNAGYYGSGSLGLSNPNLNGGYTSFNGGSYGGYYGSSNSFAPVTTSLSNANFNGGYTSFNSPITAASSLPLLPSAPLSNPNLNGGYFALNGGATSVLPATTSIPSLNPNTNGGYFQVNSAPSVVASNPNFNGGYFASSGSSPVTVGAQVTTNGVPATVGATATIGLGSSSYGR